MNPRRKCSAVFYLCPNREKCLPLSQPNSQLSLPMPAWHLATWLFLLRENVPSFQVKNDMQGSLPRVPCKSQIRAMDVGERHVGSTPWPCCRTRTGRRGAPCDWGRYLWFCPSPWFFELQVPNQVCSITSRNRKNQFQ